MTNPRKNIIAFNTLENKSVPIQADIFQNMKNDPSYHFWVKSGYENPTAVLPIWYVNESERVDSIKEQKPYHELQIETSEYFKISKQIDNTFLEGYIGRKDQELTFHNQISRQFAYFSDYLNRNKVFFTFDKISLYQVMEIFPENPLRLILKRIDFHKGFKVNQAFMIMPFHIQDLDTFYIDNIKDYLKSTLNIDTYRADDFRNNDVIIETIYSLIEQSEFVIADTTIANKNAFYELGYASAIGKEIITIQNKNEEQRLFFDRAHIRTILYDRNNLDAFWFDLNSTIESIRARQ